MIRASFTPLLRSALLITLIAAAPGFANTAGEITIQVDAEGCLPSEGCHPSH